MRFNDRDLFNINQNTTVYLGKHLFPIIDTRSTDTMATVWSVIEV